MPALVRMRRTVVCAGRLPLFPEQLGEVGVVGSLVALGGQLHHGGSLGGRGGVAGTAAAVAAGQRRRAMLPVGRQHPVGVAPTHPQKLGGLGYGNLVFQAELSPEILACTFWFNG